MPGGEDFKFSNGKSQIIDYRGQIISEYLSGGEALVSAIVNIDGLRDFRLRGQWQNLAKDMRTSEKPICQKHRPMPKIIDFISGMKKKML